MFSVNFKGYRKKCSPRLLIKLILFFAVLYFFSSFLWPVVTESVGYSSRTDGLVTVIRLPDGKSGKNAGRELKKEDVDDESMNQNCRIPKLDPFAPEIVALTSDPTPVDCSTGNEDWVFVDQNLALKWTDYAVKSLELTRITCDVTYITRKNEHEQAKKTVSAVSISKYKVESEFFLVSCSAGILSSWKKHFYVAIPRAGTSRNSQKMNVLMLGFDSVSHMEAIRALPKSLEYMTEKMDFAVLNGYNIVGDGTPQAFIPILTGQTEEELPLTRKRYKNKAKFVDVYPFVWNNYSDAGYVTGFGEDQAFIDMFSYRLKGFNKQPTDHYLRPIMSEIYNRYGYKLDCNAGTEMIVDWFSYIEGFVRGYRDVAPVFGLFHHGIYTHDAERAKLIDNFLFEFLKKNNEDGVFENTALFVMADHGARFTKKRQTNQGQLEERMPFFAVRLPEKLKTHPGYSNLRKNVDRLSTPFDIYSTYLDLLQIDNIPDSKFTETPSRPLKRSLSLLRPIPEDRTCKEADIEPHWCSCVNWKSIVGDPYLKKIGEKLVSQIINVFNGFLEEERELCADLKLHKIEKMERLAPDETVLQYNGVKDADGFKPKFEKHKKIQDFIMYRLSFVTQPGMARYEATVKYNEANEKLEIDAQAISHVNKYGDLPHCVIDRNYFLGSYCVCRDKLKHLINID